MENTFHIQWHVTDFCNLRCRHCYQSDFTSGSQLPFGKLEKIFAGMTAFADGEGRKLVIDITGGEPFLHENWHDIISLVSRSPSVAESGIISNGFFLDSPSVKRLEALENFRIKISAEGLDRENYEHFRGRATFDRFRKSCGLLRDSSLEKVLMFTVFEGSLARIGGLFDFMDEYGFSKAIIERFIPWGRGSEIRASVISRGEWKEILRFLASRCGLDDCLGDMIPYRGFMVEKAGPSYELFGAPCIIGRDGVAVMPDGTVFPCRRFPMPVGNLALESLGKILKDSPVLKSLAGRKFLKGRCKTCIIDNCFGCRALAYSITGDFLQEDPRCIYGTEKG